LGLSKMVDPEVRALTMTKTFEKIANNVKTQPLNELQIRQILPYTTMRVVPPYYNPKAPPSLGIPSLNIINVNQQLLPNLDNIVRPQFDIEKLKGRVTQAIPRPDVVQTMQIIRQRIILPFQELKLGQLQGLQTQQLVGLQRTIAHERMVSYDIYKGVLTIPHVTTQTETIRTNPSPPVRPIPQTSGPRLPPIVPPLRSKPFLPLFMPPMVPRIGPSQPGPPIQLGNAKRIEWDIAYAFKRIWK